MIALNIGHIYGHVVVECRNGCTDAPSAFNWFMKYRPDLVDNLGAPASVEGEALRTILQTINYHAVRENCAALATILRD